MCPRMSSSHGRTTPAFRSSLTIAGALKLFRRLRNHPRLDGQAIRISQPASQPASQPDHWPAMHYRRWRVRALPGRAQREPTPSTGSSSTVAGPAACRSDLNSTDGQAPVHPRQRLVRPHRELDSTNDKRWFILDSGNSRRDRGVRPFGPSTKGASFNLWQPGHWRVLRVSQKLRRITGRTSTRSEPRSHRTPGRSPFSEFPKDMDRQSRTRFRAGGPRIAFRDVARATDTRTVIAALVPGQTSLITDQAPYLLWPLGNDSRDEAYLLGDACHQ